MLIIVTQDIAYTTSELKEVKAELKQLKGAEEKDEAKIQKIEARRDLLELLMEQQKKKNLILASQGKTRIIRQTSSVHVHCSSPCSCLFLLLSSCIITC